MKAAGVELLNGGKTARNVVGARRNLLCNVPLSSGKHSWSIKIDAHDKSYGMYIGVAKNDISLIGNAPNSSMNFWSYRVTCGTKY
jgi:hypothetical protein